MSLLRSKSRQIADLQHEVGHLQNTLELKDRFLRLMQEYLAYELCRVDALKEENKNLRAQLEQAKPYRDWQNQ